MKELIKQQEEINQTMSETLAIMNNIRPRRSKIKRSKRVLIERHLIQCGSISGAQAWNLYGLYRLSAIIHRLRRDGWNIKTEILRPTPDVQFAKYILIK